MAERKKHSPENQTPAASEKNPLPAVNAARVLVNKHGQCPLRIDGLTGLSKDTAAQLAAQSNALEISGRFSLSAEAANALAGFKGDSLSLLGAIHVPVDAALALARCESLLCLDDIEHLQDGVAAALGASRFGLSLNGLHELSVDNARSLARSGGNLYLDGLAVLSMQAAKALASRHSDNHWAPTSIRLNGLRALSPEVARELARYPGKLQLNGLTAVSEAVAMAMAIESKAGVVSGVLEMVSPELCGLLARHETCVNLDAVKHLSESSASQFNAFHGALSLNRLAEVSASVAQYLGGIVGSLSLDGLTSLEPKLAEAIVSAKLSLSLNGLNSLPAETAMVLAAGSQGELKLNGIRCLSDDAAQALARHVGELHLNGLLALTSEQAAALGCHRGNLYLNGLRRVTPSVAEGLAKVEFSLELDGLTDLSDAVAEVLVLHQDKNEPFGMGYLSMNGVREVTCRSASVLADYKGHLRLRGLWMLHAKAAKLLRSNPRVDLPRYYC